MSESILREAIFFIGFSVKMTDEIDSALRELEAVKAKPGV